MKIAAYGIALNEEKHAARWAETTKGADIRVVCDTGSTDRTVEILREHGVIVHEISVKPWRFDVARNAALSLVPGDIDICLSLDMDELVDDDFFDKVKEHWKPGANKGWCEFDTGYVWLATRLHARHGIYWKYPIHEVFGPSMDTDIVSCTIPSMMRHKPDNSKSRGQYLPMLIAASKEMGKDHRIFTYLCREYYFYKHWEMVVKTAETLLSFSTDWNVERAAACRWASEALRSLGRHDEALIWAKRSIELDRCGESYYEVINCHYAVGNWQGILDVAPLVDACAQATHYLAVASIWKWQLHDMRALAYHYLGNNEEAIKYGQLALDGNPTDPRLLKNMDFYSKGTLFLD